MNDLKLLHTIPDLRTALAADRRAGRSIGFVPTMGFLHKGHMALVDRARAETEVVVVSIFVNPSQFGPNEDLKSYPRDLENDLRLCGEHGVDIVFAPLVLEIYPEPMQTMVDVPTLSAILIGIQRPGHFQGVATVVAKLFNVVRPTHAYFGEKDFQQLAVIRRMVRDLAMDIDIVGLPTVREDDGLAASSRNVRLGAPDRAAAGVISRALDHAEMLVAQGERDARTVVAAVQAMIAAEPRAEVRSVDLRVAGTLEPVTTIAGDAVVVLATVRFGNVLLIDQREIEAAARSAAEHAEEKR